MGGIVYFYVLMAYSVDPPKKDNLVYYLRDILYPIDRDSAHLGFNVMGQLITLVIKVSLVKPTEFRRSETEFVNV
jgi:hypothetical protein